MLDKYGAVVIPFISRERYSSTTGVLDNGLNIKYPNMIEILSCEMKEYYIENLILI